MTGYRYPSCEPVSWTVWPCEVHQRTIAGLSRSPLERGRDPLPRVTNSQPAPVARAAICCPPKVAALAEEDCICDSFGPLKCEFAQPRCGRYAGHWVLNLPPAFAEGLPRGPLETCDPLFSRPDTALKAGYPSQTARRASGVPSNFFSSKTTVLADANLTCADGPSPQPRTLSPHKPSCRTAAVITYYLRNSSNSQLQEGLPVSYDCGTKVSLSSGGAALTYSRVVQLHTNVDH